VIRQTRLALANDMNRVQRVFLATGACCNRELLESEHPGLIAIDATRGEAAPILREFAAGEGVNAIFLVDPLGNIMMRYDTRQNPRGLLQDLKHLLALSHIG
jgi:hypothetical protein